MNCDGARAIFSITMSRPMRTVSPSTSAPCWRRISAASGLRNSMPTSSRMRIAVSWIFSTASASTGSVGLSGLVMVCQGYCRIAGPPRRALPSRPPPRPRRPRRPPLASCGSVMVSDSDMISPPAAPLRAAPFWNPPTGTVAKVRRRPTGKRHGVDRFRKNDLEGRLWD